MMHTRMVLAALLLTAACSAQQIDTAETQSDAAVASAQPTIEMACWLVQAADAGFSAYAASGNADPSVVADEQKAVAGANAICANPPTDVVQAITDVIAAYKAVVAATPSG